MKFRHYYQHQYQLSPSLRTPKVCWPFCSFESRINYQIQVHANNSIQLFLKFSKTDQDGKGATIVIPIDND